MLKSLKIKFFQFLEHSRQHGFWSACKFTLFHEEEQIPVVKDLADLKPAKAPGDGFLLVEVNEENSATRSFRYPLRSREERSALFIRNGYSALAMVRDDVAVGDLWYVSRATARIPGIHPDLRRLAIDLADDEVYMFDMHVGSDQRGGGLATFLLSSALHHLRDKGYRRAYGYFAADNVPALWVHRLLGYRELPRFVIRRFLLYRTARAKQ